MAFSVLVVDSAFETSAVGVVTDGEITADAHVTLKRGQAAHLPMLVSEMHALSHRRSIGLVAVTVGPGSFTGLRAGLALAYGLAAGWACPVVGVGIIEAWEEQTAPMRGGRPLWVALHCRNAQILLAQNGILKSFALDALPLPPREILLSGNAAELAAPRLRLCGAKVDSVVLQTPGLDKIASIALRRLHGRLSSPHVEPLYNDVQRFSLQSL